MLAGRTPFLGAPAQVMADIVDGAAGVVDPAPEAICLKTLARKPEQRHASMADPAAALDAFMKGRPACALPDASGEGSTPESPREARTGSGVASESGPVLAGAKEWVRRLEWSPAGDRVVVERSGHFELHASDGSLISNTPLPHNEPQIFSIRGSADGQVERPALDLFFILPFGIASDGRQVIWTTRDSVLRCADFETGLPLWESVLFPDGRSAAFSGSGQLVHGDPARVESELVDLAEREPGGRRRLGSTASSSTIWPSSTARPPSRRASPRQRLSCAIFLHFRRGRPRGFTTRRR